jgi:peroxiredoxin
MAIAQRCAYAIFLALLLAAFTLSIANRGNAADYANLPANAEETTPLKTGDRAPAFTVRTVENEPFHFDPMGLERPVILISFRGGWCPYCNMHLSELKDVVPRIRESGVDIYFLSGDRPEILHSSLKLETQDNIAGLDYEILSDANIEAAVAFGTAFRVDPAYLERRKERGTDIGGSSMQQYGALPVPSVYVIDRSGRIVYDFVNADYKVRLPAGELLAAAKAVSAE